MTHKASIHSSAHNPTVFQCTYRFAYVLHEFPKQSTGIESPKQQAHVFLIVSCSKYRNTRCVIAANKSLADKMCMFAYMKMAVCSLQGLFFIFIFILFLVHSCFACVSVYVTLLEPLKLESQALMSFHVGRTLLLWNSSHCSYPLSHLFSPRKPAYSSKLCPVIMPKSS